MTTQPVGCGVLCAVTAQNDWAKRLVISVADAIKHYRGEAGMSTQRLADACAELGYPIARSVLANLESKRRDSVTLAELLVISRALNVSVVQMVFPVGRTEQSEPLPGEQRPTWLAAQWFTGEQPWFLPAKELQEFFGGFIAQGDDYGAYIKNTDPLRKYREHQQLMNDWGTATRRAYSARMAGNKAPEDDRAFHLQRAETEDANSMQIEHRLVTLRNDMRESGVILPGLPNELKHLDLDENQEQAEEGEDSER